MYKANQEALFQATNQGLISIRQSEIDYYLNVNSAIGTQAALIGGFTYGIFTQNSVNLDNPWGPACLTVYYIVTACTIATAVHVIINTMLLQVLGPGLALNGPIGSMARATEGMQIEQTQIVWSFGIMMVCFAMSTVMAFWVVMDAKASTVSTFVFLVAARTWYYFGKRVILRFHWDRNQKNISWAGRVEDDDDEPTIEGKIMKMQTMKKPGDSANPMHSSSGRMDSTTSASVDVPTTKPVKKSVYNLFGLLSLNDQELRQSEIEANRYIAEEMQRKELAYNKEVAMEGYMTKRGISRSEFIKDPWERRYFVLNYRGQIFYYKNRQEYKEDPKSRIKGRPIELEEFTVVVQNSLNMDETATIASGSTTATNATTGAGLKFQMTLIPREDETLRRWIFKVDTEETLNLWIEKMRLISPSSFQGESGSNPASP